MSGIIDIFLDKIISYETSYYNSQYYGNAIIRPAELKLAYFHLWQLFLDISVMRPYDMMSS